MGWQPARKRAQNGLVNSQSAAQNTPMLLNNDRLWGHFSCTPLGRPPDSRENSRCQRRNIHVGQPRAYPVHCFFQERLSNV
jgi:hypothetical protein